MNDDDELIDDDSPIVLSGTEAIGFLRLLESLEAKIALTNEEPRPVYDFSQGQRGRYAKSKTIPHNCHEHCVDRGQCHSGCCDKCRCTICGKTYTVECAD